MIVFVLSFLKYFACFNQSGIVTEKATGMQTRVFAAMQLMLQWVL